MSRADRTYSVHWVYRVFDATDRLIYVGSTTHVFNRLAQHRRTAWWAPTAARVTAVVFPNGTLARIAEREAIRDEVPRWNKSGKWAGRGKWTQSDWHDWFVVLLRDANAFGQLTKSVRDYESLFARPLPAELAQLYGQAKERAAARADEGERLRHQCQLEFATQESSELAELNAELRGLLDRQEALARALGVDWENPEICDPSAEIDAALAELSRGDQQ